MSVVPPPVVCWDCSATSTRPATSIHRDTQYITHYIYIRWNLSNIVGVKKSFQYESVPFRFRSVSYWKTVDLSLAFRSVACLSVSFFSLHARQSTSADFILPVAPIQLRMSLRAAIKQHRHDQGKLRRGARSRAQEAPSVASRVWAEGGSAWLPRPRVRATGNPLAKTALFTLNPKRSGGLGWGGKLLRGPMLEHQSSMECTALAALWRMWQQAKEFSRESFLLLVSKQLSYYFI